MTPQPVGFSAKADDGRLTSHVGDLGSFTRSWSYLPNSGDRRLSGISTAGLSAGQSTAFTLASNAGGFITGQGETSDAALSYPPNIPAMNATFNTLNQMAIIASPRSRPPRRSGGRRAR